MPLQASTTKVSPAQVTTGHIVLVLKPPQRRASAFSSLITADAVSQSLDGPVDRCDTEAQD